MKLPITSITPFTLQDYPDHTACILWFSGCNMACGYCHNPDLVKGAFQKIEEDKIKKFIESRIGLLDGVVLSGGECTLCKDLQHFISYLKNLGFKIKIDTNGTNPDVLEKLLLNNLVDFISLDFKSPAEKFFDVTGFEDYSKFLKSLEIICKDKIPSEIRTTVHTKLLNEHDLNQIIFELDKRNYKEIYYIQNYIHKKNLGNLPEQIKPIDRTKIMKSKKFKIEFRNF